MLSPRNQHRVRSEHRANLAMTIPCLTGANSLGRYRLDRLLKAIRKKNPSVFVRKAFSHTKFILATYVRRKNLVE